MSSSIASCTTVVSRLLLLLSLLLLCLCLLRAACVLYVCVLHILCTLSTVCVLWRRCTAGKDLRHLKRTIIGGSAVPEAMTRKFLATYGVDVVHAWGMTEMSPLGSVCVPIRGMESMVRAPR